MKNPMSAVGQVLFRGLKADHERLMAEQDPRMREPNEQDAPSEASAKEAAMQTLLTVNNATPIERLRAAYTIKNS